MAVLAGVLALSSFGTFAKLSYSTSDGGFGRVKVSAVVDGFSSVSVAVTGISSDEARGFVERREAEALSDEGPAAQGAPFLLAGLVIGGAAWLYLQNRRREAALGVIIVTSSIVMIVGLWRVADPRGIFNDPAGWENANYSPGLALLVTTFSAFVLVGLSVTALVLERR